MAEFTYHQAHDNEEGYRIIDFNTFESMINSRSSLTLINLLGDSVTILNPCTVNLGNSSCDFSKIAKCDLSELNLDYLLKDFPKGTFFQCTKVNLDSLLVLFTQGKWFIYETVD